MDIDKSFELCLFYKKLSMLVPEEELENLVINLLVQKQQAVGIGQEEGVEIYQPDNSPIEDP